jgi:hypothetical protein
MEDSSNQQRSTGGGRRFRLVRGLQPLQLDSQHSRQHPVSAPAVTAAPAADAVLPTHPSKLTLPAFWISELAAWFALAEARFQTSNITSQRVMFDLLVAALPEKNLSQVMDIIKNIPAINPFEVLKLGSWRPTCSPTRRRWTLFSSWVP